MFDLLLAAALVAALFLPIMIPTSSEDESGPSFCGSTSHALSAIRESNNGIYGDNDGVKYVFSFCESSDWKEEETYIWESGPTPISVEVEPVYEPLGDPVPASGDDPEVYTVLAGRWARVEAVGGICRHYERGYGLEGTCCSEQEKCDWWEPQPWHQRRNFDESFEYNTGEIPGDVNYHYSAPDEESSHQSADPDSCECTSYRCHERNKLWVQPPEDFDEIIDVHISRPPTKAFTEAAHKHIQLDVVEEDPTVVERDFYITPSAAAAGFGQDDVHDLVDGVNDMLKSEFEHDPSDEYVGAPRDYDSNWDGELDSSRGKYDRYVPVEFKVGDITIWNGDESFPSYLESEFADYDYVLDTGLRPMETKKDYVIAPNDSKWQSTMDKAVIVTKNFWVHVGYHSSGDTPVMDTAPEGWAHLCSCDEQCTLECPCCEGSYCDGYNTQVVVQYDVEPTVLLHEWGHNTGLRHIKPEGDSEMGYPKEGHKSNHMIIPAPDTMSSWISEEELLPLNPGGPDYIQYHRWMNTPQDW